MKKLISLLLAMIMVFSLATVTFATGEDSRNLENTSGSITISNIVSSNNAEYRIYKILDLESYNLTEGKGGTYSYTLTDDAWRAFFTNGAGAEYVNISNDYVTWNNNKAVDADGNFIDSEIAAFAKLALNYAKTNGISATATSSNGDDFSLVDGTGVFDGLSLGYYLVDSDVGALCGLTSTNPDAHITAKNKIPTIDKQVKENSSNEYGPTNTAGVHQTMDFMTIIYVQPGAEDYVLHDRMENMEFKGVTSITLTRNNVDSTVSTDNYNVNHTCTACAWNQEGSITGCTFAVEFEPAFIGTLGTNDVLKVYYQACLTDDAVIGKEEGNQNFTMLEFGEDKFTTIKETTSYSFGFDLVKTDTQNLLLDGATFRIYSAATNGDEVVVVKKTGSDGKTYYVHNHAEVDDSKTGDLIEVTGGCVRIVGLDKGSYYLEEVTAPQGYNKLSARHPFDIGDGNVYATIVDKTGTDKQELSTGTGVQVKNKGGSILPETGAMGTTMFVTFGMFAVLATGVLLVTKKRISMIED